MPHQSARRGTARSASLRRASSGSREAASSALASARNDSRSAVWRCASYRRARSSVCAACCAAAERKARSWTSNSCGRLKLSEIAPNGSFPTDERHHRQRGELRALPGERREPLPQLRRRRRPDALAAANRDRHRQLRVEREGLPTREPLLGVALAPESSISAPSRVHEPDRRRRRPQGRRRPASSRTSSARSRRDLLRQRRGQRLQARRRASSVRWRSVMSRAIIEAPDDLAVGTADRRDGERDDDLPAVLGQPLGLVVLESLAGEHLVEDPPLLADAVRGDQHRDRLTDRLVLRVAVDPRGGRVPARDDALDVLAEDRVARRTRRSPRNDRGRPAPLPATGPARPPSRRPLGALRPPRPRSRRTVIRSAISASSSRRRTGDPGLSTTTKRSRSSFEAASSCLSPLESMKGTPSRSRMTPSTPAAAGPAAPSRGRQMSRGRPRPPRARPRSRRAPRSRPQPAGGRVAHHDRLRRRSSSTRSGRRRRSRNARRRRAW